MVKTSQNRVRPPLEELEVFTNFLSSKTCHFWRVFSSRTSVLIMRKFERELLVFATEMLGFAKKTILVSANFANLLNYFAKCTKPTHKCHLQYAMLTVYNGKNFVPVR